MRSTVIRTVWRVCVGCLAAMGLLTVSGCPEKPQPKAPRVATRAVTVEAEAPRESVAPAEIDEPETRLVESAPQEAPAGDEAGVLQLEGIAFAPPPESWKRIKPRVRILDAEFELPRAEGDQHDARLTLMASGGDPQETISNRVNEFRHDGTGPFISKMRVAGVEATWVDIRGEWKGPAFERIEPHPDYRMLLVIIPHTGAAAYYLKLAGPAATVAAHEAMFRAFVESAVLTPLPVE